MNDNQHIEVILKSSPSVELVRLRNREMIIPFLINTFPNQQGAISSENIHLQLADFLEYLNIETDEENEIESTDTYEVKAKKYIQKWTDKGFLTNYYNDQGEIFFEISSHASKTIDWLHSLKKEEYIGAESKFKTIYNQLKELVEFSNDDTEKRIRLLEDKKFEIEQQIQRLKAGEDIKVFQDYEIVPRFRQITQSAKELLSDFKEVEDNFKQITKSIYLQHAEGTLKKSDILTFVFDALDALKASQQGKSFYAFWAFLLNPGLQNEWENLTDELYGLMEEKGIEVNDLFLKGMKLHLYNSGHKVYKANDKMAEKLSRIIRENETSKSEATRRIIQEIKKSLIEISKKRQKAEFSFTLETDTEINIPFERKLTFEQIKEVIYSENPVLADHDISHSSQISMLYNQSAIDKKILRQRINDILSNKTQTTVSEIIRLYGIEKGLAEIFGYISVIKEYKHSVSTERKQRIMFDEANQKTILIPEIIVIK